jgi:DNA invertase Pin-like site-specific DNA recombinase
LNKLKKGDTLIVTKLDRFSRSASKGMDIIDELLERGVAVHVLNMGLMDNTPTGKLIRNVMLAFAEFERDCIVERCNEGKVEAKLKNPEYKEGRKQLEEEKIEEVKSYINNGYSISKACNLVGIGRSTYYKYC